MRSRGDRWSVARSWWCRIFGHKFTGYMGGVPYLKTARGWATTDGCGVKHVPLYGSCDNCNQDILVAQIHE